MMINNSSDEWEELRVHWFNVHYDKFKACLQNVIVKTNDNQNWVF